MNDKKHITTLTYTIQPTVPANFIYVTVKLDDSVIIENKLSKMTEFKDAMNILSKFTNKGKEF